MKKIILLFISIVMCNAAIEATEIKTIASYDGTNATIRESIAGEKLYFSFQRGVNNQSKYFSIIMNDKKMVEINDGTYYVLSYSGQYDSDRADEFNTFIKFKGDIKFAKYISSNMFLNLYLENEYKNYYRYDTGEYGRVAPRIEVKFPKDNLNLNIKADYKYFFRKAEEEKTEIIITTGLDGQAGEPVNGKTVKTKTRRVDRGIELTLEKDITDSLYFEAGSFYGETNNNTKYGNKDSMKEEMPDIANQEVSQTYGYLGYNVYNGNAGAVTIYTNLEKDIYIESNLEYNYINSGINYVKPNIKWIGEVGVSGNYEAINKTYSLSTYLKKTF